MTGGLGSALMRRFANGSRFFNNTSKRRVAMVIVCYRYTAGAIQVLEVAQPVTG